MRKLSLAVAAVLCAAVASAQPQTTQWPDGYWDRQYGYGQQWSVMYMISVKVPSTEKARDKAVKILEQAGGHTAQNGYYGGMRAGQTQQASYLVPVAKAEKAAKQLLTLGDLQQYSTQKAGTAAQLPEVREKIAAIEEEKKNNADALEKMPISRSMLSTALTRLTQTRDSAEKSADTALISVTMIDANAPETPNRQYGRMAQQAFSTGPANEGAAKGNLGALRSALSIYYGDTEGRYPSTLAELTVGGKYLTKIPKIQVGTHKETDAVTILTGVSDLASIKAKLKDTGGWAYVADPKSPQFGTVVIDCTHPDSHSRPWPEY